MTSSRVTPRQSPSRLCVMCKHFWYDRITEWQSDCSGGTDGGLQCKKGHYYEVQPYSAREFREVLARAATCPDYDESEGKS